MKASVTQLAKVINNRFEHLLADLDEAIIMSGKKTTEMKQLEDSEQAEARRELLLVEEVANKAREQERNEKQSMLKQIEAEFHASLIIDIKNELNDLEHIWKDVLHINPSIGSLFDVLYTEACTISRLENIINENLVWLGKSLIQFVRQPRYQRCDSSGSTIIISSVRGALSFVGIESLRILIPALTMKQALPAKSKFFPNLQRHMWEYSLGSAKASQALSDKYDIKWFLGYNLGMFSAIGRSAIAKIYLKSFDIKLRQKINEAYENDNPIQAKTLDQLKPSTTYLVALWSQHSATLSSALVSHLKCRWLTIGIGLEDFARINEVSIKSVEQQKLHPLAKLLFQSQGYLQYKMMRKNGLLSKNASMLYLRNFGVSSDDAVVLTKVNLTGLEIKISGTSPSPS